MCHIIKSHAVVQKKSFNFIKTCGDSRGVTGWDNNNFRVEIILTYHGVSRSKNNSVSLIKKVDIFPTWKTNHNIKK